MFTCWGKNTHGVTWLLAPAHLTRLLTASQSPSTGQQVATPWVQG